MFKRLIKKFILGQVTKLLDNDSFKRDLADRINKEIDIPGLTEAQEGVFINSLIAILIQLIKTKL